MGHMEWNDTMREMERAILSLCSGEQPFATAADIAEATSYSVQTVLNNADGVARRRDDVRKTTVGQANVYYVVQNRFDEIWGDDTEAISKLQTRTSAEYAELRNASENSEFDFEVHWYSHDGTEIENYSPNPEEMGEAIAGYGPNPVKIKIYDQPESAGAEDDNE